MEIHITTRDFDRLCESSMRWSAIDWAAQDGRFEISDGSDHINWQAKHVYWVGDSAAAMILARAFLQDRGFNVQVLWDMAEHPNGDWLGYALITDYQAPVWADSGDDAGQTESHD